MAISSYDSVFAFGTTQLIVAPGTTNGILVEPRAGQVNMFLRVRSGGSLFIMGATMGQTLAAADLATASAHYMMGATEEILGPVRFYLAAGGATGVVDALIGLSQGS